MLISAIQQCKSAIIIHTSPPSLSCLPSPIPPGHHRAPGWAPCATQQFDFWKDRLVKYKSGQMTYLAQVQSRAVHVSEGTSILDGNVNLGFKKIFSLAVSPWVNYLISLASHFSFFPLRFLLALNEIIYVIYIYIYIWNVCIHIW